ncbi:MAG: succinate dehydrogenase cytochrome b subunit [Leptospiraceae bacterium]|nr:succinate dehydrogenase cytochrome b subunit [Leptospiraceae bacterium]MDW7975358.1 succinate dehydrogenase cytochrome b subunit [Leptospiraceae bacterium]
MIVKRLFTTSVGRKTIVAITGILLILFIIAHMLGNWNMFLGPDAMNSYAQALHDLGGLLWVARIGLLVVFVLHVFFTIQLNIENKMARPVPYYKKEYIKASLSSRTMVLSGLVVFSFVVYHLLHYTFGVIQPETYKGNLTDSMGRPDVYSMVIFSFRNPLISLSYIIAMLLLAMHLDHAFQSAFQTLGFANKRNFPKLIQFSRAFAIFVFLGYSVIPLSVLLGIIN